MRELRIRGASFENTVYNLTVKKELDEVNEDNTPKTEVVAQYLVTPRQAHFSPGKYTRCIDVFLIIHDSRRDAIALATSTVALSMCFIQYIIFASSYY